MTEGSSHGRRMSLTKRMTKVVKDNEKHSRVRIDRRRKKNIGDG